MVVSAVIDTGWIAAGVVLVVAALVIGVLWIRQRGEWPDDLAHSPHHGSDIETHGPVHVLAPGEDPVPRSHPLAPRIDPDRRYVFGEGLSVEDLPPRARTPKHDTEWALRHATRGRHMPRGSVRVLIVAALALIVLALIGASLQHGSPPRHTPPHHSGALRAPSVDRRAGIAGLSAVR
jgi:hypothetical protein